MDLSIDEIINKRESDQEIIDKIKAKYSIDIQCNESDDSIVYTTQNNELQKSTLCIQSGIAAMRRNPPPVGEKRLVSMADIQRVELGVIRERTVSAAECEDDGMQKLMFSALDYQNQIQVPLCLAEADNTEFGSDFFRRFGFHYIYDRPHYELRTEMISKQILERATGGEMVLLVEPNITLQVVGQDDMLSLAHFVNARLCRQYGLFMIRSAAYYECFQRDLRDHGGNLFQIMEGGVRKGYFVYTNELNGSIGEAVFDSVSDRERYLLTKEEKKPSVMARIVNMSELLRHIAGNGKITIAIRIEDPVIAENDGLFIWYIDDNGSRMERVEQANDKQDGDASMRPEVTVTIGEFTAFLFEYIQLKENAKFDSIYLSGPVWMNKRN
ncbi:MAG: sterol carrier protein domain-containing protein [Lachnospiraceae bacterium]|nr:sterol carrier protein domain-containing protein [Lachnospiraceae bacterium]